MRYYSGTLAIVSALVAVTSLGVAKVVAEDTAYQFSFDNLSGTGSLNLADYKGKVILIVNTASHCGFTPQYKGLQALYQQYKDQGLVVIGVPSNDFARQEPGSEEEIAKFCQVNYGVTFPMTAKQSVIGRHAHPFYQWARQQLGLLSIPKWNFHKYLINREGNLVAYFNSYTKPESVKMTQKIEGLLKESPDSGQK